MCRYRNLLYILTKIAQLKKRIKNSKLISYKNNFVLPPGNRDKMYRGPLRIFETG